MERTKDVTQKMLELKKVTQNSNAHTNKMTQTWKGEHQMTLRKIVRNTNGSMLQRVKLVLGHCNE